MEAKEEVDVGETLGEGDTEFAVLLVSVALGDGLNVADRQIVTVPETDWVLLDVTLSVAVIVGVVVTEEVTDGERLVVSDEEPLREALVVRDTLPVAQLVAVAVLVRHSVGDWEGLADTLSVGLPVPLLDIVTLSVDDSVSVCEVTGVLLVVEHTEGEGLVDDDGVREAANESVEEVEGDRVTVEQPEIVTV